jgi:hypothetical protein
VVPSELGFILGEIKAKLALGKVIANLAASDQIVK